MKRTFLCLTLGLWFSVAGAQPDPVSASGPLDYYLLQAFSAPTHARRRAIFHIGIQGRDETNGYRVTAVLENYPAHIAGLRRGDLIVAADGLPFHPVSSFNRGGSSRLTVNRNADELELTVSPVFENLFDSYRTATLNSVRQFSVGNKVIGYLRLWGFSRVTSDLISLRNIVAGLNITDGLILDLRNSYGFSGPEHIAMFRDMDLTAGKANFDHYSKPIALLLNEETGGGPAYFASQLVDLQRIVSMGEQTADFSPLDFSGSQVLIPQIPVAYPLEQSSRSDPVFQAAIDTLLGMI